MTNLQNGAPRLSAQVLRRIWLWGPIAAGGALAALLALLVLLPLWKALQTDSERLRNLESKRTEVQMLRLQLQQLDEGEEKSRARNASLFRLFTGNGDLSTFLAKLGQEARASRVQLDLYEPQVPPPAAPPAAGGTPPKKPPPPPPAAGDAATASRPLEVQGLRRHDILLSARGSFPELLTFLRRVESLNLLVLQSDLALTLEEPKSTEAGSKTSVPPPPVVLKLLLSLYARPSAADRPVPPAAPGSAPAPAASAKTPPR
jgi:type IV pilus assembly protein PilO